MRNRRSRIFLTKTNRVTWSPADYKVTAMLSTGSKDVWKRTETAFACNPTGCSGFKRPERISRRLTDGVRGLSSLRTTVTATRNALEDNETASPSETRARIRNNQPLVRKTGFCCSVPKVQRVRVSSFVSITRRPAFDKRVEISVLVSFSYDFRGLVQNLVHCTRTVPGPNRTVVVFGLEKNTPRQSVKQ